MLKTTVFSWYPNHFKHSQNRLSKFKIAFFLPFTKPARSSTCQETNENIGLVVVLPRTYPLPVGSRAFHPVARRAEKSC